MQLRTRQISDALMGHSTSAPSTRATQSEDMDSGSLSRTLGPSLASTTMTKGTAALHMEYQNTSRREP